MSELNTPFFTRHKTFKKAKYYLFGSTLTSHKFSQNTIYQLFKLKNKNHLHRTSLKLKKW